MATMRVINKELSYQPVPLYRDSNTSRSVKLDLNSLCIKRPTETFFIQIKNPNLIAWGLDLGDLVIVEQSSEYMINDMLVLEKDGEYKFYQYFTEIQGEKILFSLDAKETNLRIQEWNEVNVAGVITNVVHQLRNRTSQKLQYAA